MEKTNINNVKNEVDKLVDELIYEIKKYNPIELLHNLKGLERYPSIDIHDERTIVIKVNNSQTNIIEYFTSLITSYPIEEYGNQKMDGCTIDLLYDKYNNIKNLILKYFDNLITNEDYSQKDRDYMLNRFFFSDVRGTRYDCFQKQYFFTMLSPHAKIIESLFNVNKKDFFSGLELLMEQSSGKKRRDNLMDLAERFDEFEKQGMEADLTIEGESDDLKDIFIEMGYKIDNEKIWNEDLLDALSINLGENKLFLKGDYSGWPINNSLLKYKPILKYQNSYYCFNYYNLVDNFYRSIYKAITERKESYRKEWQKIQKDVTEDEVGSRFKKIFPKAEILRDNFFFIDGKKNNRSENDLLVIYEDTVFIVEVKAGNFTPDNPLVNFISHKKTIRDLIEKPDEQGMSFYNYLKDYQKIYNENNELKYELNISDFKNIYIMSVTLENFNEVAAEIEKFKNIKFTRGNILLSIDDLNIYADYFQDKPYLFLDFMKCRNKFTDFPQMQVVDECDHLGLYITYRDYISRIKDMYEEEQYKAMSIDTVYFDEARADLDYYYDRKNTIQSCKKPRIEWLDDEWDDLLNFVYRSTFYDKEKLINLLLNAAEYTAVNQGNYLKELYDKMLSKKFKVEDDIFVSTLKMNNHEINIIKPVGKLGKNKKYNAKIRTLARLKLNNMEGAYLLFIDLNKKHKVCSLKIEYVSRSEIFKYNSNTLDRIGEKIFKLRKQQLLSKFNLKFIKEDMPCPCGSNLTYGKCCKLRGL